jgi:membrane-bound metal-dependent hydrolase YbcI (DUF457 family)
MTWRTHVAIGANAIWLTAFTGRVDQSILILLPVAIVASLLPDIDAQAAKIHYAGGGVLGIFRDSFYGKYFHHRGLMHSFFVTLLLFIVLFIIFKDTQPLLPFVFAVSYASHPIIDGFNTSVGYLYPFVHIRFALLPKFLRFQVGSGADTLLMFLGIFGLLIFFAASSHQLVPSGL